VSGPTPRCLKIHLRLGGILVQNARGSPINRLDLTRDGIAESVEPDVACLEELFLMSHSLRVEATQFNTYFLLSCYSPSLPLSC
jgi:hypothetical protein